ncbi:sugar membrane transport protein [Salmonella enterica]|nr:sugar membrane transport protein [Salmonella enterica]
MEQITKPHCGARLDRLPDCRWHSSMFAVVAFGLLVCWSNAVGGLILAQLKALGWTDNSTTATFSAITTAGMFLGALVGGIIGDKTGRRNAFILYEAIHIAAMLVGAFSPNMSFLIACRFVMGIGLGRCWLPCSLVLPNTCPAEIAAPGRAGFPLSVTGHIRYVRSLQWA